MPHFLSLLLLLPLLLATPRLTTAQLVGPGAMAPYGGGGGGGRRHGGYVRVQDPAKGFFVAGSALRDMNGLYGKVEQVPFGIDHELQLAYKHDQTGWFMALTTGVDSEWILIDSDKRDRFKHAGKTIIPGSGQRWSHLHRAKPGKPGKPSNPAGEERGAQPPPPRNQEESDGALMHGGDDIAELPWQMIAILDESMLHKLRRYSAHHHGTVQRALGGSTLPTTGSTETDPPPHVHPRGAAEANDVCTNDGDIKAAMSLYGAALDQVQGTSQDSTWSRALLFTYRASCWRRIGRNNTNALHDVEQALALYPAYKEALFEQGVVYWNQGGSADEALQSFSKLLKLDRTYPALDGKNLFFTLHCIQLYYCLMVPLLFIVNGISNDHFLLILFSLVGSHSGTRSSYESTRCPTVDGPSIVRRKQSRMRGLAADYRVQPTGRARSCGRQNVLRDDTESGLGVLRMSSPEGGKILF